MIQDAVSEMVVCQTHTMDVLHWGQYSGLLQDGFKDYVVEVMQVCGILCAGNSVICKQMGSLFLVLFFWKPVFTSSFFSGCHFNNVKSSLQSSLPHFMLSFSFLLLVNKFPGVAHRKQTVT